MKSRPIRMTMISADTSTVPSSDLGLVSSGSLFNSGVNWIAAGEIAINDSVFRSLIKLVLSRDQMTALNKQVTMLLGLSTSDEVILSKQIGIRTADDLHGLIVSLKAKTDDVILVKRTSAMMHIYLTDSCHRLRATATLHRDSDHPQLVTREHAAIGFVRELNIWAMLAEIRRR